MKKTVVDLFCGSGGASCGFRSAGFEPVCAVDLDKKALETYKKNFPKAEIIQGDIQSSAVNQYLIEKYHSVDCVIMCPPCQSYSKRNLTTQNKETDHRHVLPFISARIVAKMRPKSIFMEEVSQCYKIAPKIKKIFEKAGYHVKYDVLYASDYGVAQKRKRFILVATMGKVEFAFPDKKPIISAGESLNSRPIPEYGDEVSQKTKKKIIALQKEGKRLIGGNYAVMDLSKPSPTIHTQSLSATGPYTIQRGNKYYSLSVAEAARLQSYPSSFKFVGTDTAIRKQIGNSVPPLLAKNIAKCIKF